MPPEDILIDTAAGALRGRRGAGVNCFRGVPYAAAPVGALRFAPPQAAAVWTGVRDAILPAAIAPQSPARLRNVMGAFQREQGEDCLSVTVWTPAADAQRRPVLVWLHGGGFVSGAGDLAWYDGAQLAREGDLVVVGVNYRLGALGFLRVAGVLSGNQGLQDQMLALQWVQQHISAFGGDPAQITLMGQSAGGLSIALLLANSGQAVPAQRAILQSVPLGTVPMAPQHAQRVGEAFLRGLGIDPDKADAVGQARRAPVSAILAAQGEAMRYHAQHIAKPGEPSPPFMPVCDGHLLPAPADFPAALARASTRLDVLLGTVHDEARAFFADAPATAALQETQIPAAQAARLLAQRPGASPGIVWMDFICEQYYLRPTVAWAEQAMSAGRKAYLYRFDWAPPASRFGATHCIELPFIFGTHRAFSEAPMLAGADTAQVDTLSAAVRASWIAFVRSGDTGQALLPPWPAITPSNRSVMHLDAVCEIATEGVHFFG